MIEKETIERIKSYVDIKTLVESKGITLKKNGKGYFGLCPFHADKHPSLSVTPSKNQWHCFGCDKGGDVIRFIELFDQVDFKEAVKRLSDNGFTKKPVKTKPAKQTSPAEGHARSVIKEKKLLARVVDYYQHTLAQDSAGIEYLKNERGIQDNQSLDDFGVGYANGTLLSILPEDKEIINSLKTIGILNTKGKEVFYNCVVFPLYDAKGAMVSLYGRNIDEKCEVSHLYLPGNRSGLVNRQACVRSQSIILTESIIDALSLYDQGFKNVMPIYGVNGLVDDHLSFFNRRIKEAYLVFDADESGKKASDAVSMQLKEKEIVPYIVELPVKDVNIYFKRHTPEEFESLLKSVNPKSLEQSDSINNRKKTLYKETDHGFIVGYADRQYQVKGIWRGDTQLKVTIKASTDVQGNLPFELTTIDLYSSRSRIWFAKLCAELFSVSEELTKEDMGHVLNHVETFNPKEQQSDTPKASEKEIKQAMGFLKNPDMFKEILTDLETIGVTGEKTNKLVGYLAAVSRKLDEPLSVLVQSRSAAGKSTLQDAILSLVPDEDFVKYTRITDQALFYKDQDSLVNKILAIEEEIGMGGAAYSIRNIQSSKKITVAATGKDPGTGKMKTEEYTVNGPVCVMITTTAAELEGETASRFLFLTVDESTKMTEAIHKMQRDAETLDGIINKKKSEKIMKKHHTAQRLLKPLAVANPYSKYLSYPNTSLRTRRDHKKYLGLIRSIAYLYQYQRSVKTIKVEDPAEGGVEGDHAEGVIEYIEVTLEDIDKANALANEVLGQSLDDLAKPSRTLLDGIYTMVKDIAKQKEKPIDEIFFTRRMIRETMGWTDWQIRAHISQLEEMQYLYARVGMRGKEYAYALNYKGQAEDNGKCYLNLTPVEEIKKLLKNEGK